MSSQGAPPSVQTAAPANGDVPKGRELATGVPAVQRRASSAASWRRSIRMGFATWAAAATAYAAITVLSFMIDDVPGPAIGRLYEVWDHWDTGHYMRIAAVGYTPDRPDTHAFFPLYPMLLRALDAVLPGPTLIATLVLANLLLIGALVVLHHFVTTEFDVRLADRTLLVLMAWPTAFYLSTGYNESLFILLSVGALYAMRRQAWWAAGAIGALASATRLAGVLLALPFAVEYLRSRSWRLRNLRVDALAVLLIPVGLALFAGYLSWTLGNPLAFATAQDHWERRFAVPGTGIVEAVRVIAAQPLLEPVVVHNLIDVVTVLLALTLLVLGHVGPWRLRPEDAYLTVYATASLMVVLTGPVGGLFPQAGAPRYTLELVPIFLVLARLTLNRVAERLYLLPAVAVQTVFLLTFLRNIWVS